MVTGGGREVADEVMVGCDLGFDVGVSVDMIGRVDAFDEVDPILDVIVDADGVGVVVPIFPIVRNGIGTR